MSTTTDAIDQIQEMLQNDPDLRQLLVASLNKAQSDGKAALDPALYDAFNDLGGWPLNENDWVTYLKYFSRWIPNQSGNPAWKNPETGYSQEVYDHLCHFYYLINQKVGPNEGVIVQSIDSFAEWLVSFARMWGDFLNTTDSFNDDILKSFQDFSPNFSVEDSMVNGKSNNPSGWLTFNQFFARELNPGLRPIDDPENNQIVVTPADCTFRKMYQIDANSNIEPTTLKLTHKVESIAQLLEGSPFRNAFANGTFVHYFLGPYSYHRFHAPVSGIVQECRAVEGLTYLEVNVGSDGQFDAPDNTDTGYEFVQARGILTIDASAPEHGNMGIVGVVPVGMAHVSGVHMMATEGKKIAKGEEFGYFLFGGSDIILLFQQGKAPNISDSESYRHYGRFIGFAAGLVNQKKTKKKFFGCF